MPCDVLDFRCVIMNELIGSVVLTMLLGAILYFIVASKLKFGFGTTLSLAVPFILILGITFAGFSPIYAFLTLLGGVLLAWIYQRIITLV